MSSGIVVLLDVVCLVLAALLSTALHDRWFASPGVPFYSMHPFAPATLVMGVLAPIMLYDPRFGANAHRGLTALLLRSHALRLTLFTGLVLALGTLGGALTSFSGGWLALWFSIALLTTLLVRLSGSRFLRILQRRGHLSQVVAIVGTGVVADRLARTLQQARPDTGELLGIFDDGPQHEPSVTRTAAGTIEQLLESGKSSKLDLIVLAPPDAGEHRIQPLLLRLKALSVPIGLCPPHAGPDLAAESPVGSWTKLAGSGAGLLPRRVITLAALPVQSLESVALRLAGSWRAAMVAALRDGMVMAPDAGAGADGQALSGTRSARLRNTASGPCRAAPGRNNSPTGRSCLAG